MYDNLLYLIEKILDSIENNRALNIDINKYYRELAHLKGVVLELKERGIYIVSKNEGKVL